MHTGSAHASKKWLNFTANPVLFSKTRYLKIVAFLWAILKN
jgi:hypothetical protein